MNNETQNKLPDEVITCVTFLVNDNDHDVQSELVGLDTKRKPTNVSQPSRHVNVISEKV
jgi:hypothetical protein